MIKFILNKVPRGMLQRLARWAMPAVRFCYAVGRNRDGGVECPLCGGRFRRFMPYGYVEVRRNALCPRCLALERHRLLWLWLERETDLVRGGLTQVSKFLHIAPEVCLSGKFEKIFPADNYTTADLESPLAKVKMDVQNIPFANDTFDVVFCNHVLEHVADDRSAMREIHRVMRPGGWGVILAPVDPARAETFEDDTITNPAQRTRIFGQYDHRRIYGCDYADRLRETGWKVEEVDYLTHLADAERQLYALRREILYTVQKNQAYGLVIKNSYFWGG